MRAQVEPGKLCHRYGFDMSIAFLFCQSREAQDCTGAVDVIFQDAANNLPVDAR